MDQSALVDLLRTSPYFAQLGDDLLERIARESVVRTFAAGERIFTEGEGDGAAALYFVAGGVVRIFKVSLEGREQVLRLMQAGDSFADVPAFDGGPYPANADAFEAATLVIVPRETLWSTMRDHPEMALGALQIMAGRLRHMTSLVEDLSLRRVAGRVAKHLLSETGNVVMNQSQLAAMLGTSREMISRSLHAMADGGILELDGARVTVLDRDRLLEIAEAG